MHRFEDDDTVLVSSFVSGCVANVALELDGVVDIDGLCAIGRHHNILNRSVAVGVSFRPYCVIGVAESHIGERCVYLLSVSDRLLDVVGKPEIVVAFEKSERFGCCNLKFIGCHFSFAQFFSSGECIGSLRKV